MPRMQGAQRPRPVVGRSEGSTYLLAAILTISLACGSPPPPAQDPSSAPEPWSQTSQSQTSGTPEVSAHDAWWQSLTTLCEQAYAGRLVSTEEADAVLSGQEMTMHVRRCDATRIEVPFHIGDNRSRTWVLTRTDTGIQLQHDHRHEDGSPDTVTLYGGHTQTPGTVVLQAFPADAYSKELFEAEGLSVSTTNVWSIEIVPGQRFSYSLRRPERFFRADFDLSQAVTPPPPPWGHE